MADNKQPDTRTARRPDCVTEIRIHRLDIEISFTTHFFGKIQYIGIKYSLATTYSVSMFSGAKNRPSIRKLMT